MSHKQKRIDAAALLHWVVVDGGQRTSLLQAIMLHLRRSGRRAHFINNIEAYPAYARVGAILLGPKNPGALEWARAKKFTGVVVVPDPDVTRQVVDRVQCRFILQRADILVPPCFIGRVAMARNGSLPLIPGVLKRRWLHGAGVHLVRSTTDLIGHLASMPDDEHVLIEEFLVGTHWTIYFIGTDMFAFERQPFAGECGEVLRDVPSATLFAPLVDRFRRATGLLFGKLDFVITMNDAVWCVDAGVFPRFQAVDGAAHRIAGRLSRSLGVGVSEKERIGGCQ